MYFFSILALRMGAGTCAPQHLPHAYLRDFRVHGERVSFLFLISEK